MSFQFVIDNAAELSVNRRPVVGQTISRGNVVRTVSRGGALWKFDVRLPNGPRWTDYRAAISLIENLDRYQTDTVKFNNPGHDWFIKYQGDLANPNLVEVEVVSNPTGDLNTVTIVSAPVLASGFLFRVGDVIQLGADGKCYTVVEDVAHNATQIKLHRPLLLETAGTKTLRVAANCEWQVQCISFPTWTLFARDQISWSGSFVFQEVTSTTD